MVTAQAPAPANGREAATAILRLLHGLDPATRLSALALASRILRSACPAARNTSSLDIRADQVWVPPTLRGASRTILGCNGVMLTFRDKKRVRSVPVPEFRTWAKSTGARPI